MRIADHVYTDQADIDRIQARIFELPNDQHVELEFEDGRVLRGIVSVRPTIQMFFDRAGREGANATVRLVQPALDDPEGAGWIDVFLDRVTRVRHLDRHELEPWQRPDASAAGDPPRPAGTA